MTSKGNALQIELEQSRKDLLQARNRLKSKISHMVMEGEQSVHIPFPSEAEWTDAIPGTKLRGVERDLSGLTIIIMEAESGVALARHRHEETVRFYVLRGEMEVFLDNEIIHEVKEGEYIEIPPQTWHATNYTTRTLQVMVLEPPLPKGQQPDKIRVGTGKVVEDIIETTRKARLAKRLEDRRKEEEGSDD